MGHKKPRVGKKPGAPKSPTTQVKAVRQRRPVPSPSAESPAATLAWRFSRIDLDGSWGWGSLAAEHAQTIFKKCEGWETMREGELFGAGGNKLIPAENMCREAQGRLTELDLDDHGALWELRLQGAPRIWGLRSGHVFYPVWWDPDHTVCPSNR